MGRIIAPLVEPLGWDWRIGMRPASFPRGRSSWVPDHLQPGADKDEYSLSSATPSARRNGRTAYRCLDRGGCRSWSSRCVRSAATLATIKRESNSYRWPLFTFTVYHLPPRRCSPIARPFTGAGVKGELMGWQELIAPFIAAACGYYVFRRSRPPGKAGRM